MPRLRSRHLLLAVPLLVIVAAVALAGSARMRDMAALALRVPGGSAAFGEVRRIVETPDPGTDDEVARVLAGVGAKGIFAVSAGAIARELATKPFVEDVVVERRLPNAIVVRLHERKPVALWQDGNRLSLIDGDGRTFDDRLANGAAGGHYADLPLLVGANAAEAGPEFVAALGTVPGLAARMTSAVRINGRRWDLVLRNGCIVRLPEGNDKELLDRLMALDRRFQVLDRRLVEIDLRSPNRLVLREPAAPADAAAPVAPAAPPGRAAGH